MVRSIKFLMTVFTVAFYTCKDGAYHYASIYQMLCNSVTMFNDKAVCKLNQS